MNNTFQIQETVATSAATITQISKATIFADEENGTYRATVKAYNAQDEFVRNYEVNLTQEEYDSWGTDDMYIYDLILARLGLIKIS